MVTGEDDDLLDMLIVVQQRRADVNPSLLWQEPALAFTAERAGKSDPRTTIRLRIAVGQARRRSAGARSCTRAAKSWAKGSSSGEPLDAPEQPTSGARSL